MTQRESLHSTPEPPVARRDDDGEERPGRCEACGHYAEGIATSDFWNRLRVRFGREPNAPHCSYAHRDNAFNDLEYCTCRRPDHSMRIVGPNGKYWNPVEMDGEPFEL